MKTYLITLFSLSSFLICNSQVLKVKYSEKSDLTEELKSIDDPLIKQMVIQEAGQVEYYTLISDKGISLYKDMGNNIIYKDIRNKKYIRQTEFMSRTFLIEDDLKKNNWIISDDTLKIGNYNCRKAIMKDKTKVIAWFTDKIPSNEGPRDFYGLPGLILKVTTGIETIQAIDISILKNTPEINKPSKGKKVNRKEFERIQEEKIKILTGGKAKKGNGVQIIKM